MDGDPEIHVPVGFLRLVSGDGFSFTVEEEYAQISIVLKTMMQSAFKESRTRIVHLPHVKGQVLEKGNLKFHWNSAKKYFGAPGILNSDVRLLKEFRGSGFTVAITEAGQLSLELLIARCVECALEIPLDLGYQSHFLLERRTIFSNFRTFRTLEAWGDMGDMDGTADSKEVFEMPTTPRSPCEDGMSHSVKPPSSRAGQRKKLKSRAKSRGKPASQGAPSTDRLGSSRDPTDGSPTAMDADLTDILTDLDGIEQRITQILGSLQKEMAAAANFMLDCIMAGIVQGVDAVRCKIPETHKMRLSNRAASSSLRALDGIDRA